MYNADYIAIHKNEQGRVAGRTVNVPVAVSSATWSPSLARASRHVAFERSSRPSRRF